MVGDAKTRKHTTLIHGSACDRRLKAPGQNSTRADTAPGFQYSASDSFGREKGQISYDTFGNLAFVGLLRIPKWWVEGYPTVSVTRCKYGFWTSSDIAMPPKMPPRRSKTRSTFHFYDPTRHKSIAGNRRHYQAPLAISVCNADYRRPMIRR